MIRYLFTLLVLTLTNLSAAESMKLTLSETAGACSEPRPENRPSEGSGKRAEEGRRQIELFSRKSRINPWRATPQRRETSRFLPARSA